MNHILTMCARGQMPCPHRAEQEERTHLILFLSPKSVFQDTPT